MKTNILNLSNDKSLKLPANLRVVFLCGVIFGKEDENDKRTVLKAYLQQTKVNHPIILEEHFTINQYTDIGVRNLHDIETLVGCFADAIIIIHESISTAAELGMLASNKTVASKLLVLHPDIDSVEERKISSFIKLAFYGKEPVLAKESAVAFYPAIKRSYDSNDRYTYHTTFPNNLKGGGHTTNGIDAFLNSPTVQPMSEIIFDKARFNRPTTHKPNVIDYYEDDDRLLQLYVSPMAMRYLLFSLLSLGSIRDRVEKSMSISAVLSTLEKDLNELILATLHAKLGLSVDSIKVNLKGLELSIYQDESTSDYRKTIGLFVYLLKAMGYLSDENNEKFKFTRQFTSMRDQFANTVTTTKKTAFEDHLNKVDVK